MLRHMIIDKLGSDSPFFTIFITHPHAHQLRHFNGGKEILIYFEATTRAARRTRQQQNRNGNLLCRLVSSYSGSSLTGGGVTGRRTTGFLVPACCSTPPDLSLLLPEIIQWIGRIPSVGRFHSFKIKKHFSAV